MRLFPVGLEAIRAGLRLAFFIGQVGVIPVAFMLPLVRGQAHQVAGFRIDG